jgi:UDP-N-acetylglucosamine 2-epimerase (non-hydrolysing)
MKVMTVLGTRPEIIRLSLIIKQLDEFCDHVLVHTGQNFEERLNGIFFRDLELREPDHYLGVRGDSFGEQIGHLIIEVEKVILKEKPDRVLILGDTNSGLASLVARRMGLPVFHLEAGNRCYDDRVPEEVNRRVIDHSSTVLLPYTHRSKENLLAEGIPGRDIHVIGNPIYEVMRHYADKIDASRLLAELGLKPQGYFLATAHRAENVDDKERLTQLLQAFDQISKKYNKPVICSLHPRTRDKMANFGLRVASDDVRLLEPFGFFDFVALEKQASCVITDSGTVQEECCILKVPNLTIRDVTERPETLDCGSNMLTGVSPEVVLEALDVVLATDRTWDPPAEYLATNVADRVVKLVLGYLSP